MKTYYNYQIKKVFSITDFKTIEKLELEANFSFPPETHDFHEFVYIKNGLVTYTINGKEVALKTGQARLILPGSEHSHYIESPSQLYIICFKCTSPLMDVLASNIKLSEFETSLLDRLFFEAQNSFIFPFTTKMILKKNAAFGAQQLVENLLEELLIMLLRSHSEELSPVKNNKELQENILQDIIAILRNSIYEKLTLTELCKKVYYSATYLNALFKEHKKTTIMKYYQKLKLEEAEKLLKSGLAIKIVSEKLCFEDVYYFGKVFKQHFGTTPSQYLKNITTIQNDQ